MKRQPIPEIEAAAGHIVMAEKRGEETFPLVQRLEADAMGLGMDSEEAWKTVKGALKRARARHVAAAHGLDHLKAVAASVDAAIDKLLAQIATFEAATRSIASCLADHMDVSVLDCGEWSPIIAARARMKAGKLASWVPSYEEIRELQKPVSVQDNGGASH